MPIVPLAFVHPLASVDEGVSIGERTRVEAFCVVKAGAIIGRECLVESGSYIGEGAILGDHVVVRAGAVVNAGVKLGKGVEVHPCAVLGKVPKGAGATARVIKAEGNTIIGQGSQIGPHAVVYQDVIIGEECLLGEGSSVREQCRLGDKVLLSRNVTLNYNVRVGSRVKIMDMTHITGNSVIEDDVFISTLVATTNDNNIGREGYQEERIQGPTICKGASIGAAGNILPQVVVGPNAVVGAGAVVTKNVPQGAIVKGVPARITGYVGVKISAHTRSAMTSNSPGIYETSVKGVKIYRHKVIVDLRGKLAVGEYPEGLPFMPKRYYLLYGVPSREVRGEHAHKALHQFLVCLAGECSIIVDDGAKREEIVLNDPSIGVYRPPMVWGVQYKFTPDAVLLVLASEPYDAKDYIRDYDDFLAAVRFADTSP